MSSLVVFYNSYLDQNPSLARFLSRRLTDFAVLESHHELTPQWLRAHAELTLIKHRRRLLNDLTEFFVKGDPDQASFSPEDNDSLQVWLKRCLHSLLVVANRYQAFGVEAGEIRLNETLPVSQSAEQIRTLLNDHQVLVVAGETGSGKTTQLPKICAQLERGLFGRIAHTQPRRLAARTVASRIAEELDVTLGEGVGYQFRFEAKHNDSSRIQLMTDGMLLNAIHRDRLLLEYDTIIVDEAHERSLTIDFILGYLKTLLPKRPDLKVIITSATIDVERFADFFSDTAAPFCSDTAEPISQSNDNNITNSAAVNKEVVKKVPVVTVEGRSYPVTMHYLEQESADAERELEERIAEVIEHIQQQEKDQQTTAVASDILVFLPGEREIRDVRGYLQQRFQTDKTLSRIDILPLYARLSRTEQNRLFQRSSGSRRVVLATNVAETSITVPHIGYVIDSGLARISRFSVRTKLQRLQIEKVSQASANQRAGRCGRIAAGHCYRLYTEEDFLLRPAFTDPEILRTHLAEVILQMLHLNLGNISRFPFIDSPENKQINAGFKTLEEIGALKGNKNSSALALTKRGKQIARLPIDPRLGSMLLSGMHHRVLPEMLVIVSSLATLDPKEIPEEKRQAAIQSHSRFNDLQSDFLSRLNLWCYVEKHRAVKSSTQWRKQAKKEYLSWLRLREWREVHRQLTLSLKQSQKDVALEDIGFIDDDNKPETNERGDWSASYEAIHRALITGLYANFGQLELPEKHQQKNKRAKPAINYKGARNRVFRLAQSSVLSKKKSAWVLASEIVETKSLLAHTVGLIRPHWLVEELQHLIKYNYGEPYWQVKRGQVMVDRTAKLFGITVIAKQAVSAHTFDAVLARTCFIQQALVARELNPDKRLHKLASFWQYNEQEIERLIQAQARLRKGELLLDDVALAQHYDHFLPKGIYSRNTLANALTANQDRSIEAVKQLNQQLKLDKKILDISHLSTQLEQFPSTLIFDHCVIALSYCFAPAQEDDGVTAIIPIELLQTLSDIYFEWLVPGLLLDKIIALIKALPKNQRRMLVPAPQVAEKLLASVIPVLHQQSLYVALARQAEIHYGVKINSLEWKAQAIEKLDPLYFVRFCIVDERGKTINNGRDITILQKQLRDMLMQNTAAINVASQPAAIKNKRGQANQQQLKNEKAPAQQKKTVQKHWPIEHLAEAQITRVNGVSVKSFAAIIDVGDGVLVEYELDQQLALSKSRAGILKLALLELAQTVRYLKKQLFAKQAQLLGFAGRINTQALREQTITATIMESCFSGFRKGVPCDQTEFESCLAQGRTQVVSMALVIEESLITLAQALQALSMLMERKRKHFPEQLADIEQQLTLLLADNFCLQTPFAHLTELSRYIKAINIRLDNLGAHHARDSEYCKKLSSYQQDLQKLLYKYSEAMFFDEQLNHFRWLLEELRVSLFAQQLKTKEPASFARLQKAWEAIDLHRYPEAFI